MDITAVITTYNQPLDTILPSVLSIVRQKDVNVELIIADDCSRMDYSHQYEKVLKAECFDSYHILRNTTNKKTVLNIADALSHANTPYVKVVDAGDLLYNENTLSDIVRFCKINNVDAGFGNLVRFRKESDSFICQRFIAPRRPEAYCAESNAERCKLLKAKMESSDWIPAPAQFYKTTYYQTLLYQLYEMGVRYCQDFTATLALIEKPVRYFDMPIYWYEWGTGISTSGNPSSREKLYKDHMSFYNNLRMGRPLNASLNKAYLLFLIKQFIALRTPLYEGLTRILGQAFTSDPSIEIGRFFSRCMIDGAQYVSFE